MPKSPSDVAIHEWGHALEAKIPGAAKGGVRNSWRTVLEMRLRPRFKRFSRTAVTARANLAARMIFEKAFRREGWYVGKDYGAKATEIISMGLQYFHNDPSGFCQKDPEFATFILGILDGSLRSP